MLNRARSVHMFRIILVCLAIPLAGCGTIVDPSPYNPKKDRAVLDIGPYTAISLLTFTDASDASIKLQALSDGYADQRDNLMREQLLFDVPMIGLAAAAVVNPLFNGAKNTTLALGLGSAAAGGGRLYFGPQTKVATYNKASLALGCAATAASGIAQESSADRTNGLTLVGRLNSDIQAAAPFASANAALMTARDQAIKSVDALQAALAMLAGAPTTLQAFANDTVRSATNQIVSNVQNVQATEQAFASAAVPKANANAVIAPKAKLLAFRAAPDPSDLQNEAAQADAMTQRINVALGALPKCSPSF